MQLNNKNTKAEIRGRNEKGNQFAKYYQELYDAAQNPVHKKNLINFFQKLNLPTVTEEQNITLTKPITEEEIHNHIKKFKLFKSPGSDGYTNEFFNEFQLELVHFCVKHIIGH